MKVDDRVRYWHERWEQRRLACLDGVAGLRGSLTGEAVAILDEAQRLASVEDPNLHANADVEALVDRVNLLDLPAPILLHRPVCNGLTQLRIAAQEVLAARAGVAPLPPLSPILRQSRVGRRTLPAVKRFVVVSEDAEVRALVEECARGLEGLQPLAAATLEDGLDVLRPLRDGSALVVVNLTLRSGTDVGPFGLRLADEARRRHHAVLLLTAAADYLHYWSRLEEVGLTGHDVIVKTRRDFAGGLRRRIEEVAQPPGVPVSFDTETGHVVRIGDVEIAELEAQEALVLHALDNDWRTPSAIAAACSETDLQPSPGSVPPLISALRRKLAAALVAADSMHASREMIETRRREGQPSQYRLASWLEWDDPPDPPGAADALPPVLVIEDDPEWADWLVAFLRELNWPVEAACTVDAARQALAGRETPILIVDLGLPDSASGRPELLAGLRLIEEVAAERSGVRVVVLSVHSDRDSVHRRLFEAGVRTVDVLHKTADREEARAVLMASLQRAADEMWRGIRRPRGSRAAHRVKRIEHNRIEVDDLPVARLSPREADVLDLLIRRSNLPVMADILECCYPDAGSKNKVHQTFKRLRQKIDRAVGREGVGASVLRTPHRGALSTYELHGVVVDLVRRT